MRRCLALFGVVGMILPALGRADEAMPTPLPPPTVVMPVLTPKNANPPFDSTNVLSPPPVIEGMAKGAAPVAAEMSPPPRAGKAAPAGRLWTTASVTLRGGPSADAAMVDELTPGTEVRVVAGPQAAEWTRVRTADGQQGYIRSSYLAGREPKPDPSETVCEAGGAVEAAPISPGGSGRALADANLRAAPSCDARVLDVLNRGARVTVIDREGDWYRVEGQGWQRVYVHRSMLGPAGG
jgi:SH3-like domain-containing protein